VAALAHRTAARQPTRDGDPANHATRRADALAVHATGLIGAAREVPLRVTARDRGQPGTFAALPLHTPARVRAAGIGSVRLAADGRAVWAGALPFLMVADGWKRAAYPADRIDGRGIGARRARACRLLEAPARRRHAYAI